MIASNENVKRCLIAGIKAVMWCSKCGKQYSLPTEDNPIADKDMICLGETVLGKIIQPCGNALKLMTLTTDKSNIDKGYVDYKYHDIVL